MASKVMNLKLLRPRSFKLFYSRFQSSLNAVEQSLHNAPPTEVSCLQNGLRVASENSGGETCTVGLWIDTGSRFETESNNGITNFLDHMIFKGTQNRSQLQLEAEVENMGAYLNSYTSREQTAYYAKCLKKDLPAIVNILGDAIQNPLFDEETMDRERTVILKQMEDVGSNLEEVVLDYLHTTAFQGTTLAMSPLGTTDNVKSITKLDLQDYVRTEFTTPRMAIAAAGGVNHETLVELVDKNFTSWPTDIQPSWKHTVTPCRYTGSKLDHRDDFLPLAHAMIAVEGCGWGHPDYFVLMIARMIIGSFSRSLGHAGNAFGGFAQETYKHHLAEAYSAFNLWYSDTGLFGVHLVCDGMQIEPMVDHLQREWMRLCTSVSDSDVDRAKAALKTNLLLQLSDTTGACDHIGQQMLVSGRCIPLAELINSIDVIDAKMFKKVFTKYIYDKCPVVAAKGPTEALVDYNSIRSHMYWLPL